MRKFEQVGIEHQLECTNQYEALQSFKHSCNICCYKGINISCDRCGIAQTHSEIVAYFADRINQKKKGCHGCVQQ